MIFRFLLTSILILPPVVSNAASDLFLVVVNYDQPVLESISGRYWGHEAGKALFTGGPDLVAWLDEHHVEYSSAAIDSELSSLFIWYGSHFPEAGPVLYFGDGFAVAASRPGPDVQFRRLTGRESPPRQSSGYPGLLLTYDPVIDQIISEVSQDSIFDLLSRLSGASPIEIDGQPDTIHTRYSGSSDNELAAEYIREILAGYGYNSEFHGFYGGQIRHTAAYDENLAWLVTEDSEVLKTSDGGQDWAVIPDGTNNSLWGVDNWGPDLVWISGNNGTIRFSDDGGDSFAAQNSGSGAFLFGICFVDSLHGWVAGDFGTILHTSNGGQNWSSQNTPTSARLYDVNFVDAQNGWACGRNGAIIHTSDGGTNWGTQNGNTNQRLYGIDFVDNSNGWVVGWGGVVRHTTDGGENWQTVNLGTGVEKYHVEFPNEQTGCIAGWNGEIFLTIDGGATWNQMTSGSQADFHGLAFADTLVGYAGGNGGLVKTTDGGQTWFSQTQNIETAWHNVIATKTGTTDPDQQVIICGHFDDRSEQPDTYAPGADDNGSGTTAAVEAARIFSAYNFEKTIKFCLWTGEEQGLLGSAAYAAEAYARGDNIVGVFNFDMIAWDGNNDGSVEFHTGTSGPSVALGNLLVGVVDDYDISLAPDIITYGATGASDHASFWDYNYPAMLGIEDYSGDFNPYYHSTGDNIDHIDNELFYELTRAAIGGAATLAVPDTAQTWVDCPETVPGSCTLYPAYPNPFNSSVTISFTAVNRTEIDLAVYDILGRRVAVLCSGPVEAGSHRVTWHADDQPSGVYFYRLSAGENQTAGRVTLLK